MLTVAQLVELQIVVLVVVSSILIRQPNRPLVLMVAHKSPKLEVRVQILYGLP